MKAVASLSLHTQVMASVCEPRSTLEVFSASSARFQIFTMFIPSALRHRPWPMALANREPDRVPVAVFRFVTVLSPVLGFHVFVSNDAGLRDIGLVHHEHDELTLLDFGTFGDPILYLWSGLELQLFLRFRPGECPDFGVEPVGVTNSKPTWTLDAPLGHDPNKKLPAKPYNM